MWQIVKSKVWGIINEKEESLERVQLAFCTFINRRVIILFYICMYFFMSFHVHIKSLIIIRNKFLGFAGIKYLFHLESSHERNIHFPFQSPFQSPLQVHRHPVPRLSYPFRSGQRGLGLQYGFAGEHVQWSGPLPDFRGRPSPSLRPRGQTVQWAEPAVFDGSHAATHRPNNVPVPHLFQLQSLQHTILGAGWYTHRREQR